MNDLKKMKQDIRHRVMACMRRKFPLEELAAAHEKTPCKDGETEPSRQRTGQALNPKEGLHLQHLQQGL